MEDGDDIGHLVVSRLPGERLCIGDDIAVEVVKVLGKRKHVHDVAYIT